MANTIARRNLRVLGDGLGHSLIEFGHVPAPTALPLTDPLRRVDEALAQKNFNSAARADRAALGLF